MLCPSPAPRPAAHPHKRAVWLFPDRGILPETWHSDKSRIRTERPSGNLIPWLYG